MAPKRKRQRVDLVREARLTAMLMGLENSPHLIELIYGITSETIAYPKIPQIQQEPDKHQNQDNDPILEKFLEICKGIPLIDPLRQVESQLQERLLKLNDIASSYYALEVVNHNK